MQLDTYRTPSMRRALRIGLLAGMTWFAAGLALEAGWLAMVGAVAVVSFGSMVEE
jgi:hypothetical protein